MSVGILSLPTHMEINTYAMVRGVCASVGKGRSLSKHFVPIIYVSVLVPITNPIMLSSSACGIQFCSACHEEENGHGECTQCLPHTTLYHEEGECLFGLRAEILEVAEEQEKEVEEEEKEKEVARLQCECCTNIYIVHLHIAE